MRRGGKKKPANGARKRPRAAVSTREESLRYIARIKADLSARQPGLRARGLKALRAALAKLPPLSETVISLRRGE